MTDKNLQTNIVNKNLLLKLNNKDLLFASKLGKISGIKEKRKLLFQKRLLSSILKEYQKKYPHQIDPFLINLLVANNKNYRIKKFFRMRHKIIFRKVARKKNRFDTSFSKSIKNYFTSQYLKRVRNLRRPANFKLRKKKDFEVFTFSVKKNNIFANLSLANGKSLIPAKTPASFGLPVNKFTMRKVLFDFIIKFFKETGNFFKNNRNNSQKLLGRQKAKPFKKRVSQTLLRKGLNKELIGFKLKAPKKFVGKILEGIFQRFKNPYKRRLPKINKNLTKKFLARTRRKFFIDIDHNKMFNGCRAAKLRRLWKRKHKKLRSFGNKVVFRTKNLRFPVSPKTTSLDTSSKESTIQNIQKIFQKVRRSILDKKLQQKSRKKNQKYSKIRLKSSEKFSSQGKDFDKKNRNTVQNKRKNYGGKKQNKEQVLSAKNKLQVKASK